MGIGDSYLRRQRKQNAIRGLINEGWLNTVKKSHERNTI